MITYPSGRLAGVERLAEDSPMRHPSKTKYNLAT